MKRNIFLVVLCFFSIAVMAQPAVAPSVKGISLVKRDTVILRWAPTTALAWEIANRNGFVVKRYTVFRNGVLDTVNAPEEVVLTPSAIKPLPLDDWETLVKKDRYAAIAAQALYGESFSLSNPSSGAVQFFNQTEDKESRYSFALFAADHSAPTAKALALQWIDTSIKKNEKYVYRIYLGEQHPTYKINPGTIYVDPEQIMKLPEPEDLKAEFGDQSVSLNWKSFYLQNIYVSYKVERSEDDGKTFYPANDQVFLNTRNTDEIAQRTFFVDSLPANYKVYHYRVRGITPFGELGPPSASVKGVGLGSAKGAIAVVEMTHVYNNGDVYIQWRFPQMLKSKLKGFSVAKGKSHKGPFVDITKELISPKENHVIDKNPQPVTYYIVRAVGEDGTVTTSFPALVQLEDFTPPKVPTGLSGSIDQKGIVSLTWKPNDEADLSGYRVFTANDLSEEFVLVTNQPLLENNFADTVNIQTLTQNIYYKVVSLDNRYNASDYSQPILLKRPDVIPPSATQFTKAESGNGFIDIEWHPGVNDDIAKYTLQIASTRDTTFRLAKEFLKSDSIFKYRDTAVTPGNRYHYRLFITDEAGLRSKPTDITVNAIDYFVRESVSSVRYGLDRDKHLIKLEWDYNHTGVTGYQIYKAREGGTLRLYKFVSAKQFTDKALSANTKYVYAVRAIFENGAEGELSKPVEIVY
jgi:uncharacterized protein